MPLSSPIPPDTICVLDTQMIIAVKNRLPAQDQWPMLLYMSDLLESGYLTFPRQVAQELAVAKHPDGPGIWAIANRAHRRYPDASDESMAEVLDVAPGLFDPNEERNQADPYVVALAYELRDRYPDSRVLVATENTRDQPPLVSPATACGLLGIECVDWDGFLNWCPAVDDQGNRV